MAIAETPHDAASITAPMVIAGSPAPEIGLTRAPTRTMLTPRSAEADPARAPLRAMASDTHVGVMAPHGTTAHTGILALCAVIDRKSVV